MKVIKPYAEITDYGSMNLLEKIELAGRLCYKSEDKISPGSAQKFVADVIKKGHMSVLEMGHLVFEPNEFLMERLFDDFVGTQPKYFNADDTYISCTPRALIEARDSCELTQRMFRRLCMRYPVFGTPWKPENNISLSETSENKQHHYIGVRFIVGRHTSHELVRHRANGILQESQRYCNYSLGKFGEQVTFIEPVNLSNREAWLNAMLDAEESYFELLKTNTPQVARTVLPNSTKTEVIIYANLVQWNHILNLRTTPACDPSMLEIMVPLRAEFERRGLV